MVIKKIAFTFIILIFASVAAFSQTPGATQYPTGLDSQSSLPKAVDNVQSPLTAGINSSVTTFTVTSGPAFPQPVVVWIDLEQINCTTYSSGTFSTCTRGANGTTAASHLSGAEVQLRPSAVYIEGMRSAIIAMQTLLGTNASQTHPTNNTVPVGVSSAGFLWSTITNAQIDPSAAIAYSKLNLSGSVLNSDLAGSIAYSKLNLSGSIVNADISGSAAIANSKLANSSVTIGSTSVSLGSSSTTVTGLTSVNSTSAGVYTFNSDSGINRVAPKVVAASSGGNSIDGFFVDAGTTRVSSQFNKSSDTSLANVTGLSVNVAAGRTYTFEAVLFVTLDATGLGQVAIGGTATATSITLSGITARGGGTSTLGFGVATSMGSALTFVSNAQNYAVIKGTITVNAGGTLTLQFAESVSSGTSSVLVGSTFTVKDTGN